MEEQPVDGKRAHSRMQPLGHPKAQLLHVEPAEPLKLRRNQHRVAEAKLADAKAVRKRRRLELAFGEFEAGAKFDAVAVRIPEYVQSAHSAGAPQGGVGLDNLLTTCLKSQQQRAERVVVCAFEAECSDVIARPVLNDQPLSSVVKPPAQTAVSIRHRLWQSQHLVAERPPGGRGGDVEYQVGQSKRRVHISTCTIKYWVQKYMISVKMDDLGNTRGVSAVGLPTLLERALHLQPSGLGKKERTRRQLLQAALQVFAVRGVGASTIQEIAENAGMTAGTVYNHFDSKEAVVQAVAAWLADTLCGAISESQADVREGAQRMAIGQRRFIELAEQSPAWALVILDIARAAPEHLAAEIARYAGADLRLGISQGDFKVSDEAAAMDLIMGVPWQAMRSVAMGMTSPGHDMRVTAMLLQGLGMAPAKAARVAAQPLPPLRDDDQHRGMSLARGLVSSGARTK